MRKHGSKAEVLLTQGRSRNKVMRDYVLSHYLGSVLLSKKSLCPENYALYPSFSLLLYSVLFDMIYCCLVH